MGKNKVPKNRPMKTYEQRQEFADNIKKQLSVNFGLCGNIPEINQLYIILEEFVKTGESVSGSIPFPEAKRNIQYILSNRAHVQCQVNLLLT